MDIRYCDVCGSLVNAIDRPIPAGGEEFGLLCEVCLRTRRVLPDTGSPERDGSRENGGSLVTRFRCPYCDRKLRVKPVRSRVDIDCPRCKGSLILFPGGAVERGDAPRPATAAPIFRESSAELPIPQLLDDVPGPPSTPPPSPRPSSESGRSKAAGIPVEARFGR